MNYEWVPTLLLGLLLIGITSLIENPQNLVYGQETNLTLEQVEIQQKLLENKKIELELEQAHLEIEKSKIELEQIKDGIYSPKKELSEFEQNTINSVFGIIASIIAISLTALYTWHKSTQVIPLSDQEKFFRTVAMKDYDSRFKEKWKEIQCDLHVNPSKLEDYWKEIGKRSFPQEKEDKVKESHEKFVDDFVWEYKIDFAKKRVKQLSKSLARSAESDYFKRVETKLPQLITLAVMASLPKEKPALKDSKDVVTWEEKSLNHLKWLMIMNGISEHEQTLKVMISAEIRKIISQIKLDKPNEKSK